MPGHEQRTHLFIADLLSQSSHPTNSCRRGGVSNLNEPPVLMSSRPPGCGKSTIITPLCKHIHQSLSEAGLGDEEVICVSMDGWHFTRAELDGMADPDDAHWRRVEFLFVLMLEGV